MVRRRTTTGVFLPLFVPLLLKRDVTTEKGAWAWPRKRHCLFLFTTWARSHPSFYNPRLLLILPLGEELDCWGFSSLARGWLIWDRRGDSLLLSSSSGVSHELDGKLFYFPPEPPRRLGGLEDGQSGLASSHLFSFLTHFAHLRIRSGIPLLLCPPFFPVSLRVKAHSVTSWRASCAGRLVRNFY